MYVESSSLPFVCIHIVVTSMRHDSIVHFKHSFARFTVGQYLKLGLWISLDAMLYI